MLNKKPLKVLLVEDDEKLSRLIKEFLSNHGFIVVLESRGDKALYRIQHESFDLIILDIQLPGVDGLQIAKMIRKDFQGYILMLTARGSDEDHVEGLGVGVDDYLNKPVHPKVLLARIEALGRRQPYQSNSTGLNFGKLEIDLEKRIVILGHEVIDLKPTEYELLVLLASNAGIAMSRDSIMRALRGIEFNSVDRSIDLRISYLRKKLGDDIENPFRIKTVRGKGYVFQPDAWDEI